MSRAAQQRSEERWQGMELLRRQRKGEARSRIERQSKGKARPRIARQSDGFEGRGRVTRRQSKELRWLRAAGIGDAARKSKARERRRTRGRATAQLSHAQHRQSTAAHSNGIASLGWAMAWLRLEQSGNGKASIRTARRRHSGAGMRDARAKYARAEQRQRMAVQNTAKATQRKAPLRHGRPAL